MNRFIERWQLRVNVWGILGLWLPFFLFFGMWGKGFFVYPLWFAVSGGYFRLILNGYFFKPFNPIHAGCSMDQPTIGKFMIWFVVFSFIAIIVSVSVRLCCDFKVKGKYLAFAIPFSIVIFWVFSFLLVPASMLFHYIYSMGMTFRRQQGLCFIAVSFLIWMFISIILMRRRSGKKGKA